MIRDLSQLSFRGAVTLHSGDARIELIARDGGLEIHIPRGQGLLKLLSVWKSSPSGLPLPSFFSGTIPVFVWGRPFLEISLNPSRDRSFSWKLTLWRSLKKKT